MINIKQEKLDPEPGSKSQARLNLLKKRKEEAELTGDYRSYLIEMMQMN